MTRRATSSGPSLRPSGTGDAQTPAITTLIFTDLDGTLLDDRYDLAGAASAMDALASQSATVIPVTSKTLPEVKDLSACREQATPLIFENGAGIAWPLPLAPGHLSDFEEGWAVQICGTPYLELCRILADLRQRGGYRFKGFADLSPAQIAEYTGLSSQAAELARQRRASEPLCWSDGPDQLAQFREDLAPHQLQLVRGGRFYHVMPLTDKAHAAALVVAAYRKQLLTPVRILACGDSPNDQALLDFAEACVLFPRAEGGYLTLANKPVIHAPQPGAQAWLTAVQALLSELNNE